MKLLALIMSLFLVTSISSASAEAIDLGVDENGWEHTFLDLPGQPACTMRADSGNESLVFMVAPTALGVLVFPVASIEPTEGLILVSLFNDNQEMIWSDEWTYAYSVAHGSPMLIVQPSSADSWLEFYNSIPGNGLFVIGDLYFVDAAGLNVSLDYLAQCAEEHGFFE